MTALILTAVLAIQTPYVQTYLSEKAVAWMSDKTDGDIMFEKIHFKPFNALIIRNLSIIDKEPQMEGMDTLFKAGYVIARFSLSGLLLSDQGVYIKSAYISEAEMNLAVEEDRVNLTRIFHIVPKENPPENDNHIFTIDRVEIEDMTFRMKNCKSDAYIHPGTYGIDWSDMEVNSINLKARELDFTAGVMSGTLDILSFTEKSGYVCNAISGKARVGDGKTIVEDFRLSDPWSEIDLAKYAMYYDGGDDDFKDYINKIRMEGIINESRVDMKTISYFAPQLEKAGMKAVIKGKMTGPVRDMTYTDIIAETDGGVKLRFDGRMTGLPDTDKTYLLFDFKELHTDIRGIEKTIEAWAPETKPDFGKFTENVDLDIRGKVSGSFNNMHLGLKIGMDSGFVRTDLALKNLLSSKKSIVVDGSLETEDFDIGGVLGSDFIRQCSMRTSLCADLGDKGESPSVELDSLIVDRLKMNGYDYRNIAAAGTMSGSKFDGRIICNDPNLNFMIQGMFSLSAKTNNTAYKFYADLGYANLNALNFDKRGKSDVSFQAVANFNRIREGDIIGNVDIREIVLENDAGKHEIGKIAISSQSSDNLYRMNLNSGFADASFSGSAPITDFFRELSGITLKKELPALFRDSTATVGGNKYRMSFRSHNSIDLLAYLAPGLYVADSTALDLDIDRSGIFTATMTSPRIAFKQNFIKNLRFDFDNKNDVLGGELTGSNINAATLKLEENSLKLYANDNFVGIGYNYENSGDLINRGEFIATADISGNRSGKPDFHIEILPSRIFLNSAEWRFAHSSLDILGENLKINTFNVTNGDQRVALTGGLSVERQDTLRLQLERFDISVINSLFKNSPGIAGALTGEASYFHSNENRGLLLEFLCDSTRFAEKNLGTLEIGSKWNEDFRRFDITAGNLLDDKKTFDIYGSYTPALNSLDMALALKHFDISYVDPFAKSVFNGMSGHISGLFKAEGPVDALKLSSRNARIDDSMLSIAYTNVPYNATGTFHLDDDGIHFDDIGISDRYGNSGKITGAIYLNNFQDIVFDTQINVNEMECLNLSEQDNDVFYGNIFGTGIMNLTGSANNLKMDIDATTTGSGQIHIPLASSVTAVSSDLLTFKEEEKYVYVDPYEEMMKKIDKKEASSANMTVKARINATPGVEAYLEVDKSTGNVLRGRGSGNIGLEIGGGGLFNIFGDYTINSGNYRFVAEGITYRDFVIQDGSSVKFTGDIMESILNIDAQYKTKASLSSLIADTSSVSTRRTIECGINISDKIKNPRLSFSINIPDIDPAVKSRVESALSTEDKVQKQFLSLIVFNSFLPDEQSGIVNNNNMLFSTVSEIMDNQLNSIFQKLDIPIDLALNYRPTDKGNDLFDVAVSTQFFNNRIVVNGNIGNRQYGASGGNSDVVGDLDIEIKLDKTGFFRLNLFSHSADQYTNYLDNSQRNGVGVAYQQEFNTIKEFFKNLFISKRKKEAMANEEAEKALRQERKRITIEAENEIGNRNGNKDGSRKGKGKVKCKGKRERQIIPDTLSFRGE